MKAVRATLIALFSLSCSGLAAAGALNFNDPADYDLLDPNRFSGAPLDVSADGLSATLFEDAFNFDAWLTSLATIDVVAGTLLEFDYEFINSVPLDPNENGGGSSGAADVGLIALLDATDFAAGIISEVTSIEFDASTGAQSAAWDLSAYAGMSLLFDMELFFEDLTGPTDDTSLQVANVRWSAPVFEPQAALLLLTGLAGVVAARRRAAR